MTLIFASALCPTLCNEKVMSFLNYIFDSHDSPLIMQCPTYLVNDPTYNDKHTRQHSSYNTLWNNTGIDGSVSSLTNPWRKPDNGEPIILLSQTADNDYG